jgi:2-polyprenyl-6-hydroxyphenyl methylase / 3-demethylubiquinone-9 3-methyltransferase
MMQNKPNVDIEELNKFSELAHKWWDKTSEFKPLHDINPLRLNWIDDAVSLEGKSVLDVGCGGGILSESMAARGAKVMGIDLGDECCQITQLRKRRGCGLSIGGSRKFSAKPTRKF